MSDAYDKLVAAALAQLTTRQRDIFERILVHKTGPAELAAKHLVAADRALEWIEEARLRFDELMTLECQRARLDKPADDVLRELVVKALRAVAPEKLPLWLRGSYGARVRWAGPISLAQLRAETAWHDRAAMFQVYGQHVVSGPDSLLYIAYAPRLIDQLNERVEWLQLEQGLTIHVGELSKSGSSDVSLEQVAALTIWWHTPPFNAKHITSYVGPPLIVQNIGQRGRLLPMYASEWPNARPV